MDSTLLLHDRHVALGAAFAAAGGMEMVGSYGDVPAEYAALQATAGLLDLSHRGRLVLLGADRHPMLNGQVTNNVRDLTPGQGCYATLVNAKARILADLYIYALPEEILLDLEPGVAAVVSERLHRFIVAQDVQVVDAAPHYGLLSVQGPRAAEVVRGLSVFPELPASPLTLVTARDPAAGDLYVVHQPRLGTAGFDLFLPNGVLPEFWDRLTALTRSAGGRPAGWSAFEMHRIEAGIPRHGQDFDETHLPPEAGLEGRAVSYSKGCYSGQEVIARIRTYGQVAKALRGFRLEGIQEAPPRGTRLFRNGKEVGMLTSVLESPKIGGWIALGYARRECNQPGSELRIGADADQAPRAIVVPLPFAR